MSAPASTTNTAQQTAWLSWLKIFAVLAVVSIHTVADTAVAGRKQPSAGGTLAILIEGFAVFCVPTFVMVSGALLLDPARFRGPGEFLRKRAWRLIPAIIVWHLVYWGFRCFVLGQHISPGSALALTLNGKLYPHLYYLWIALGLAVVAVVLIPWIASSSRTAILLGGLTGLAMPILTVATTWIRGTTVTWIDTPWTWWVMYVGYFILGWSLRNVILRGVRLCAAIVAAIALGLICAWTFQNPNIPVMLQRLSPLSYYSATVAAFAILVYIILHSLVRPQGSLRVLATARMTAFGRYLADATLGVYLMHPILLWYVRQWLGVAAGPLMLLTQIAIVFSSAYLLTLLLRKVPFIRRVL